MQESASHILPQGEEVRTYGVNLMVNDFYKVKCADCGNEQVTFSKASTTVTCNACGKVLVTPEGGKAKINAEVVEVYN